MIRRQAFNGKIKPGMEQEYIRRHNEIWPELVAVYWEAGIRNMTCFLQGNKLYGYYELDEEIFSKAKSNPIEKKWDSYMEEIMETNEDPIPPGGSLSYGLTLGSPSVVPATLPYRAILFNTQYCE